ncbi:hypothetical protein [Methylobacterium planeticum]|uniref:Uncharacterized protein n=1 Tax=Methylobacterium planeticum TaxID=2615211 RepID=A0A6N6MVC3_9HYPH|nr:hypothetical protein [Methylobacterium planeticum]KAB1074828.1 hypothetical protein F6X51_06825 [Methylobacterium planeticum]
MQRDRREPRFDFPAPIDAPGEDDPDAMPPRLGGFRLGPAVRRAACAAAIIAGLSLLARETMRSPSPAPAPEAPLAVAFVPASALPVRPAVPGTAIGPRYRLGEAGSGDPVRAEPARFNAVTGLREDALSRGDFSAIAAPHLRLTITEGVGAEPNPSLFVAIARRAADGPGLSVTRTGERGRIDTKFGAFETLEATLVGAGTRICTGFSSLVAAPIRIEGWLCAPLGLPPEPRALVCALDGLGLDGPADPATEAVFREAQARRDPACRPSARQAAGPDTAAQTGSIGAGRRAQAKK